MFSKCYLSLLWLLETLGILFRADLRVKGQKSHPHFPRRLICTRAGTAQAASSPRANPARSFRDTWESVHRTCEQSPIHAHGRADRPWTGCAAVGTFLKAWQHGTTTALSRHDLYKRGRISSSRPGTNILAFLRRPSNQQPSSREAGRVTDVRGGKHWEAQTHEQEAQKKPEVGDATV